MTFKEQLLKKIHIDRLADEIAGTIGPADSGQKINRDAMRRLLEMGGFRHDRVRDLEIYDLDDAAGEKRKLLVLDNELPIYLTTVEDVAMRKSPTVKEMVSIRNAIKILNDSDVKLSKKQDSLRSVQQQLISTLDLSFDLSDIEQIAADASLCLERENTDGVLEALDVFGELLDFKPAPRDVKLTNFDIRGSIAPRAAGEVRFGPIIIYSRISNVLSLVDEQISTRDKERIEFVQSVALGKQDASLEGPQVIDYLKRAVIDRHLSK
jgi:hypothetical protein